MNGDSGVGPEEQRIGRVLVFVAVQLLLGGVLGGFTAMRYYPLAMTEFTEATGVADSTDWIGTASFWASWIFGFVAVLGALWLVYRVRVLRAFAVATAISFVLLGIPFALVVIAIQQGAFVRS
ncbi:hypothetical protein [Nocardia asteroides]|uniref:hypothetical protein n=1 Tax=Nocardia asteroides TaxID=1824 RepID=UPI001E33CFA5|nr:hypothetical protein [Nocardia asteroides]UGT56370.1 hypothetical protein LTT85_05645 [Nocardia asteroides]